MMRLAIMVAFIAIVLIGGYLTSKYLDAAEKFGTKSSDTPKDKKEE